MRISAVVFAMLVSTICASAAEPATWPQWRGPNRDGIVAAGSIWPETIQGDGVKQTWRIDNLGPSYSGPLITEELIITTETVEKKTEVVTAFDRKTCEKRWTQKWPGEMSVPFFAAANGSWIRSTPTADGERLYVAGIRDRLVCIDLNTGDEKWTVDFVKEFNAPAPTFGCVCSPLVGSDGVYVQAGACFAKLNKETGKVIWKSLPDAGGMNGSAFSSPVLAKICGKSQILVQSRTHLSGVDPASGKVHWSREIPSFRGMNIQTPLPVGDAVFTSTYGGTTQLFKVTTTADGYRTEDGWNFKYEGNMTSPVVLDGHAYVFGKDQRFTCVDLKAGKPTWKSEKSFGKYWSLVANGDKILALDQKGILYLIKANPAEFEILDQRKVAEADAWAHLAVAGPDMVVRDLTGLTLFRWPAVK